MKHKPDHYTERARKEGFPARSVYKFDELQHRFSLVRRGDAVLDIGASPGSWTLRLLEIVGKGGVVVALDRKELPELSRAGKTAVCLQMDITNPEEHGVLNRFAPFDAIVSDAAPNTSGHRTLDTARSAVIVESSLALTARLLKSGGNAAFKLFQGGDEQSILSTARTMFDKARIVKPKACRDESFEVFLVCTGKKAGLDGSEAPSEAMHEA
ncbi:MAG: SAM-dependent methyltransferase [Spirochaetaceae bacterium]